MSLVLDSSATIARLYIQETTPAVRAIFDEVAAGGAWVPALWRLEVANVLEMNLRRGHHDASFRDATLADLAMLPIQIDGETNDHAWSTTLQLAEKHTLTLYDAAYLELAKRRNLPLATLERQLGNAAIAEGIQVLG